MIKEFEHDKPCSHVNRNKTQEIIDAIWGIKHHKDNEAKDQRQKSKTTQELQTRKPSYEKLADIQYEVRLEKQTKCFLLKYKPKTQQKNHHLAIIIKISQQANTMP